ncbi:hypothetical protein A3K01_00770 [candidate division WWE3 bacterium RIFOXYD1_FULL_43_17]|uniref:Uncharacterized protein n=3 Tax=Katanobacteria TaxID=422282 RepID=A0A1F4XEZ2_UNCKA|nr:MAG: hypothetical protein UU59_C0017G0002 [candidate division WWE3 bacterium GW2011_GWE1_41_27]KKS59855.1 MAG: hypothetical protein UV26_C0013G0002 [candidate division WWE3 bacterium GW2011_GWF2_42_42]OGC80222.1 MAG: hypothetical protein A3K01_00770 [candidate division WWE3 bacterium RIFOXYD1_FULL_43_17]
MIKPDPQIAKEIEERSMSSDDFTLDSAQYELLRLRGDTKETVEKFEKTLSREISYRCGKNPLFIPELWIACRVKGYEPRQIEYDWVYASR